MFPVTKSGKNLEGKGYVPSVGKNGPALVWTGICRADPSVELARFWSMPGVGCRVCSCALRCVWAWQGKAWQAWRGLDTNQRLPSHKSLQCNIVDMYVLLRILPAYRIEGLERDINLYGLRVAILASLAECCGI